jgi:hypothetical protein
MNIIATSFAIASAAAFWLAPAPASAHSWYPKACCSGHDCESIPMSAVSQTPQGYHVIYTSPRFGRIDEYIPMSSVQGSRDGEFHGCWRPKTLTPRNICFFAPANV